MTDYISIIKGENTNQVCLYNTEAKVMEIGEKMNALIISTIQRYPWRY